MVLRDLYGANILAAGDPLFRTALYPPDNAIVLGQRWASLIWWIEPFALLVVCIVWGALLAIYIEHPANAYLRQMFSPRKQARA